MAVVFLARDPDPGRREHCLKAAENIIAEIPGFDWGSALSGPTGLVWGSHAGIPVQTATVASGVSFVMGEPLPSGSSTPVGAQAYWGTDGSGDSGNVETAPSRKGGSGKGGSGKAGSGKAGSRKAASAQLDALDQKPDPPNRYDGYHLGLRLAADGSISAATDPMGLFPVYLFQKGDVFLLASSIRLLKAHPAFEPVLDPLGVTSVLLINGAIEGQTPFTGVNRLPAGAHLHVPPDGPYRTTEPYRLPLSNENHNLPRKECAHRLHDALAAACKRHVPAEPQSIMLSGGLDSRLLAGILARQGVPLTAVTMGIPSDMDVRCASEVAGALSLPHHSMLGDEKESKGFPQSLWWRGFARSPGTGGYHLVGHDLTAFHPRVITGYLMDAVIGGSHLNWCYDPATRTMGFDPFYKRVNSWGIQPEKLRGLFKPGPFRDAIDEVREKTRKTYEEGGDTDLARAWAFDLSNRQRFWIGDMLTRVSFGAWPRLPHLDWDVLKTAASLPLPLLANRQLEEDMVKLHYPTLARLSLDRTTFDSTPLDPTTRDMVTQAVRGRWYRIANKLPLPRKRTIYYFRTFDFNNVTWQAIRADLEPHRTLALELFNQEAFDEYLPPAGTHRKGHPLHGSAGPKMMLGLLALLKTGATVPNG